MDTMILGDHARAAGRIPRASWVKALGLSLALAFGVAPALAAAPAAAPVAKASVDAPAPAASAPAVVAPAPAAPLTAAEIARTTVAPGEYVPMKPTPGKGMPTPGALGFQKQYSPDGDYAKWMHDDLLMPIIVVISVLVLGLLLFVMIRFRKSANPVPSKTSHNMMIEIIWTVLPAVILLAIFVPSMKLLGSQFRDAPAKALTIKATGNQWFWTYTYPDNGGFEVISNMLSDEEAKKRGEPGQLGVDYRLVVPAGEPIRIQTTAADVIHAFAVPSLWFKIDAVPGRINERVMFVKEPGVYYGQCSELCGARHGYMPIAVEALPRAEYNRWVIAQGGTIDGLPKPAEPAAPPAAAPAASASPAAAASASPAPGA